MRSKRKETWKSVFRRQPFLFQLSRKAPVGGSDKEIFQAKGKFEDDKNVIKPPTHCESFRKKTFPTAKKALLHMLSSGNECRCDGEENLMGGK